MQLFSSKFIHIYSMHRQFQERYFALDGLRAIMMLLGLVLHAALCYATYTFGVFSSFHDAQHSYVLTGVIFLLHLFRMPLFFLLAGFFAALLWQKYGAKAMLRNRVKRVLLPLMASWAALFPLIILAAAFTQLGGPKGIANIAGQLENGQLLAQNNITFAELFTKMGLIHLWFLYFLMLFYGAMAVLLLGSRKLPASLRTFAHKNISRLFRLPAGGLFLFGVTWFLLYLMPAANLHTTGIEASTGFLIPFRILATYFLFFAFGWGLFRQQQLLSFFSWQAWRYTGLGLAAAGLYAGSILHPYFAAHQVLQTAFASLAIWLLALGILGLALRYLERPTAAFSYLSGASYWVYLVHVPFALLLPGFLIGYPIPALLKFLIVCAGTAALSLLSYHWLVRSTRLGSFINGRQLTPYRFFSRLRKGSEKAPPPPAVLEIPVAEKQQALAD